MDNLRGFEPFGSEPELGEPSYAAFEEDDAAIEAPPVVSGDERRMQVRAYNFWTAQLHDKNYPSIEELDPEGVQDFREFSVLLDFTSGIENPSIPFVGEKLREECGLGEDISYLDQVPARSLLSRITDHYLQIIANRAPIGFEAEFVNERGLNIMYRGILLPYSSDDDTIDFIYGVINWKEGASNELSEPLQLEVEQALAAAPPRQEHVPVWADGPTTGHLDEVGEAQRADARHRISSTKSRSPTKIRRLPIGCTPHESAPRVLWTATCVAATHSIKPSAARMILRLWHPQRRRLCRIAVRCRTCRAGTRTVHADCEAGVRCRL